MPSRRSFLRASALAAASPAIGEGGPRPPVAASIKPWNNKPTLFVDGKPVHPAFYALTDAQGGRWSFDEIPAIAIGDFTRAGFKLFQLDLFLESVWPMPGPIDIAPARRQLRGVLDQCPDAAIVLRWHLNAPRWWASQHEDQWTRYANGEIESGRRTQPVRIMMDDLSRQPRVSLASKLWRDMATAKTRELLRALAQVPEGNSLAGIHLACGVYGEWHYWGFMRNEPDTSAPMQAHFDAWRGSKGKTPAAIPSVAERAALDDGIFRDPAKRETVVDYYRSQQELVADNILHFCRAAKRAWPRQLLTGSFYGYFFSMFDRSATGGHLCVEKILASPDIDYLSAPQAYGDAFRGLGASGITRGLTESARLHGKLFLDEMDQTPSWQWRNDVDTPFRLSDLASDTAILRRNMLASYTRGSGLWFYDFGPGNNAGWWADTRLMDEIAKIKKLLDAYHRKEYKPAGDVLFVYDTEVFYFTGSIQGTDALTDPQAVNRAIIAAYASGAAIETIHLSDLQRVDLDRFKVVVFGNTWLMSAEQRKFVRRRVMSGDRHVLFQGAPAYCDGRKLDVEFTRDVTGLDIRRIAETKPFAPQFAVEGEASGLARRGSTWFSTQAVVSASALREILQAAGAHVYVDTGDVVHAGGGLVLIHTKDGGKRGVRFRSGREVEVEMPPKSSWIFDAESGERVL